MLLLFAGAVIFVAASQSRAADVAVLETLEIASVPAGFPVGFCLLTEGQRQYVAYYDAEHRLTVAFRTLDSVTWQYQILPTKIGWDSHNYMVMAIDDDGFLHLSGNMHCVPLIYFRTTEPWDISTFEKIPAMTGANEQRCTYPKFMRDADGRLIFHYRDGGSGNGNEIYNVYDVSTRTWRRLLDRPLTDGKGQMNAYMSGPSRGPDGWFHLCWVWRDTPDCSTNHDPSYARSRDLIHWETLDAQPVTLPITIDHRSTLIDPVPAKGGIINGCLKIGFDSAHQPLASYHKYDSEGNLQAYVARFENSQWVSRQVSDWSTRWEFKGNGSIVFEVRLGSVRVHGDGKLALPFSHSTHGGGLIILDEKTLRPLGTERAPRSFPKSLSKPESGFPGMRVKWATDHADANGPDRFVLRWETLPSNRDRRRDGQLPEPAPLRLYRLANQ